MKTNETLEQWRVDAEELQLSYRDGTPCETLHIRDDHGTVAWVPAGFPARARLIAAAPEMFEALKEIATRGPVEGYASAGALLVRLVATQSIARAALAKVEGGV